MILCFLQRREDLGRAGDSRLGGGRSGVRGVRAAALERVAELKELE